MTYQLHKAVLKAGNQEIRAGIEKGMDLNELDELGNSPLHWAVLCGYDDIVKLLLDAGANPNVLSTDGITPKWSAVDFGLVEIENILTKFGGKVTTGKGFENQSSNAFKEALGQKLPKEEK